MKKLLLIPFIILFYFQYSYAANQNYFVTPTGNGSDPDCSGGGAPSCAGAWDMSDINSSANWSATENVDKVDPGDTVYFNGSFTNQQLHPPAGYDGTSGSRITLDGYYGGDCDPVADMERPYGYHDGSDNASVLQDLYATWTSNTVGMYLRNETDGSGCTITSSTPTTLTCTLGGGTDNDWDAGDLYTLDVGGNDPTACPNAASIYIDKSYYLDNILLDDNEYFTIQDFNLKGAFSGINVKAGSSDNYGTIIRRNYIHDMYGRGIRAAFDTESDPYQAELTIGGADGDGNYVFDTNERCQNPSISSSSYRAVYISSKEFIVSHNFIANNPSFQNISCNTTLLYLNKGYRGLVEKNVIGYAHGGSGTRYAYLCSFDHVFRFNRVEGCGMKAEAPSQGGVTFHTSHDTVRYVYFYGNYFLNNRWGISLLFYWNNVNMWANVIVDSEPPGSLSTSSGIQVIRDPDYSNGGDLWFTNNTISRSYSSASGTAGGGINFSHYSPVNARFANNLLYYNNRNTNDRQFIVTGNKSVITAITHTTVWSGDKQYFYYDGSDRTATYMNGLGIGTSNKAENPLFVSPDGDDGVYGTYDDNYSLSENSPSYDDGTNAYSDCWYPTIIGTQYKVCRQYLLDPSATDFGTIPPTVETIDVSSLSSWPRGAYAPGGPETNIAGPIGKQSCGTNPQTITISVDTPDNNSDCRYSNASVDDCNTSYDDLDTAFTNGQGTTSHTTNVSQSCGGSTIYNIKCKDTTTERVSGCTQVVVDVAEYTGAIPPLNIWYNSSSSTSITTGGNLNIDVP